MYIYCEDEYKNLVADLIVGKDVESNYERGGELITIHSPYYMRRIALELFPQKTSGDKRKDLQKTALAAKEAYRLSKRALESPAEDGYSKGKFQTDYAATRNWAGDKNMITIKFHNTDVSYTIDKRLIFDSKFGNYYAEDLLSEVYQLKYTALKYTAAGIASAYIIVGSGGSALAGKITLGSFLMKSTISAYAQYYICDGEVDVVDVFADGLLAPGWSAVVGGSYDVTYNFKEESWSAKTVFWGDKTIKEAAIEGVIGFAFDKTGAIIEVDMLKYYKSINTADELMMPLVFVPIEYSKILTLEISDN